MILYHSEDDFILFRIFLYCVTLLQKCWGAPEVLAEYLRSTSFCIQPVWEHLGASGRISVAVQKSWVGELWLPNHFTFCWCTSLTIWLHWEQAVSGGLGYAGTSGSGIAESKVVAVECSLSPLTIWLRWAQAVSGGMLTLTSLTIWLRWEHAVGGWSGFAGCSGSGFAGSKAVSAGSGFAGSSVLRGCLSHVSIKHLLT